MKPYGYKRGQENGIEPWENPKNFLKSKKKERQEGNKIINSEINQKGE